LGGAAVYRCDKTNKIHRLQPLRCLIKDWSAVAQISTGYPPNLVTSDLASTDPNPQNGLAIVVAAEPDRRAKFFEINILIFKSPVCKDLRGVNEINI
jgi:hypothetical protein